MVPFNEGGPVHRPTTLADALGVMAHPLARTLAEWRNMTPWQRLVLRRTCPELVAALDELDKAAHEQLDPL